MKAAFQKDDALLRDIAEARERDRSRLWWLGQSGFLLVAGGKSILFDPYLSDSLTRKYAGTPKPHTRITERVIAPERLTGLDVITSSHNHTDHLDAETLRPLLEGNPAARLLIPRANRAFVLERLGPVEDRLVTIDAGESLTCGGVRFYGVPAAHNTVERDELGRYRFLGYVAQFVEFSVYHSGDTLLHDGLIPALVQARCQGVPATEGSSASGRAPSPPEEERAGERRSSFSPISQLSKFPDTIAQVASQIALLPINGNKPERGVAGNLNGKEAANLAESTRASLVIPHHFDMFEFNTESPDEFEAECRRLNQPFRTLRNGEGLDL
jgi:L-ascorbate metabolism protein UlaG (beta-lactamase superfamily)